jgi:hypothetical protein
MVYTKKQLDDKFNEIFDTLEDACIEDFRKMFDEAIKFATQTQKESIYKVYDQLGFPIDLKELENRINDDEGEFYDELYSVNDLTFTSIDLPPSDNRVNKSITIYFEANDRGAYFKDMSIKIDNNLRIEVDLDDTPWEGGGVESEIIDICMKYLYPLKYK